MTHAGFAHPLRKLFVVYAHHIRARAQAVLWINPVNDERILLNMSVHDRFTIRGNPINGWKIGIGPKLKVSEQAIVEGLQRSKLT